jgi:hypothetical protein
MGRCADKLDVRTEVLMSGPAMLATTTSTVWVHGDERAARKPLVLEILRQPPPELVARDERLVDRRRPDPSILVVMEIAAAQTYGGDIKKRLAGPAFPEVVGRHASVPRRMDEECSRHCSGDLRATQM